MSENLNKQAMYFEVVSVLEQGKTVGLNCGFVLKCHSIKDSDGWVNGCREKQTLFIGVIIYKACSLP